MLQSPYFLENDARTRMQSAQAIALADRAAVPWRQRAASTLSKLARKLDAHAEPHLEIDDVMALLR